MLAHVAEASLMSVSIRKGLTCTTPGVPMQPNSSSRVNQQGAGERPNGEKQS